MGVQRKVVSETPKQKEWRLRAGGAWDNCNGLVVTNEIGRHLAAVTGYNNFKIIVKSIDMEAIRMHDLRHTFAMLSLQNSVDI